MIAVDPDFHGQGLGSEMTLAGLDHLASLGIETALLYVDAANDERGGDVPAPRVRCAFDERGVRGRGRGPTGTNPRPIGSLLMLPTWSVADVHESFEARSFLGAKERAGADVDRLITLFDEHDIRATEHRTATADDGAAADARHRRVQPRGRRTRRPRRVRLRVGGDRLPQRRGTGRTERDRTGRVAAASPPRPPCGLGRVVRPRRPRRCQPPGSRAPRPAQSARRAGRSSDVGGRGAPVRGAVDHRGRRVGPTPARGHLATLGRGRPPGRHRTASAHRRPWPGDRLRTCGPPCRVRRRVAGVADRRGPRRCRDERHQGRGEHRQPST